MVSVKRHLVFLLGVVFVFGFAVSFQWISLNPDYLSGISNLGIFRLDVGTTPSVDVTKFKVVFHQRENIGNSTAEDRPQCPETSSTLVGPLNIDLNVKVTIDDIIAEHGDVSEGGHFKPAECTAHQRIAIVVPFRNRETHLKLWLYYLLPILKRQQGDFGIYVIEQFGDTTFNRAKLMNVGFNEAQREYDYNCFIFSDIDIIPMDDRNFYRCGSNPRHMANAVDKFGFSLPYDTLFGGVVAFTKDQFLKINGYSNMFWGWGGEDDELYSRVAAAGMKVERPNSVIAKSRMIVHNRDPGNESNGKSFPLISQAQWRMRIDGLRTLSYKTVNTTRHKLYTKITVDLGQPGK
ncbi:beta-1,4-galactosyltransferase 1-like [Pleurodeles waltl]|uniref:beta-1,4-galactosyltransferase 1-like n=1 Tax=Pleurodeles waltl TaxID=8319 RepID=UPI0037099150